MEYRRLGKTGIAVSAVSMGCWALAGDFAWGPQDDADSIATVHAALDVGVNLFDTAEGYGDGRSEAVLGTALAGRRSQAVIATKVSGDHLTPNELQGACERSLRRLGTDYIDIYQIHWANPAVPLADTLGALERLRDQGAIREFGVCNFGTGDLDSLLSLAEPAANQLPYSLLWRGIEFELLPRCVERQIGVLCYSPLAQGLLTGKYTSADEVPVGRARTRHFSRQRPLTRHGEEGREEQTFAAVREVLAISQTSNIPMVELALAWVLAQPGITSVLAGARQPEQMVANAQAAGRKLPPDIVASLSSATADLKRILGTNLDQYQSQSRFR